MGRGNANYYAYHEKNHCVVADYNCDLRRRISFAFAVRIVVSYNFLKRKNRQADDVRQTVR